MMGAFGLLVIVGISLGCLNDPDAPGGGNPANIHERLKGISYSFRKYNMTKLLLIKEFYELNLIIVRAT